MNINEILKLEVKKQNLKKVESFIAKSVKHSKDYYLAVSFKASMLYKLDNVSEAITLLLENITSTSVSDAIVSYTSELIKIYLDLQDFSKAKKYIDLKKEHLTLLNAQEHTKDLILYYYSMGDKEKTKQYIKDYLEDDITEDDKLFVTSLLSSFAYEEKNLSEFLNYFTYLENKYIEKNLNLEDLYIKKLELLFEKDSIEETKKFISSLNLNIYSDKLKIRAYTINISILIKEELLRKAATLDATYEEEIRESSEHELLKKYYKASRVIYEKLNNLYSLEYIDKCLNNLSEEEKSVEHKQTKFKELPNIIIQEKKEETPAFSPKDLLYSISDKENVDVSENYNKFEEIISFISKNTFDLTLRETIRQSLVLFSKNFNVYEVHILDLEANKAYLYKGGRLYDKLVGENLDKSILKRAIELKREIILNDISNSYYNYDIVNATKSSFKSCIVFPLFESSECEKSIGFFFVDEIKNFEYYKFFTSLINFVISKSLREEKIKNSKDVLSKLENRIPLGFNLIKNNKIILNDKSCEILKVSSSNLSLDEYVMLLDKDSKETYQNAIFNLTHKEFLETEICYKTIMNQNIKERLFYLEDNYIYSYIEDVTKEEKKTHDLIDFAYLDSGTNVKSFKTFKEDAKVILNNHNNSIVILDAKNFKIYQDLYGYDFSSQIIYSMGFYLDKANELNAYHLDSSRFILLFNRNDKRYIKKAVDKLLLDLKKYIISINKRVLLDLNAGIYRQTTRDKNLTINEYLDLATEAYLDACDKDELSVIYDDSIYDDSYFTNYQKELDISEAIDNNKLESKYISIYNLDKQSIIGYLYKFSLDNILLDEESFLKVVKKRNLYEIVDKYKIRNALENLKLFYNKTGYYFNLYININAKSINLKFVEYIKKLCEFYKINPKFLSLDISGEIESDYSELKNLGISIGVDSIDNLFLYDFDTIYIDFFKYKYQTLVKLKTILSDKRLIILDAKTNEDVSRAKLITPYLSGKNVSREKSINELIELATKKEKK